MSQAGVLTAFTGGGAVVETLTGNSGGSVGPDGAFNINILGNNTSGINVVGNPGINTLSIVGIQATTAQRGTVFLATDAQAIAGTDTVNALTSSNLTAKLGTQTAHSLAVFEGTASAVTALGVASNGQLPIGSTGADPVLANITSAGSTIVITNGAGSISLDVNGSSVGKTITGNSGGALSPTAGNWNILGASTAAGTSPVTTSGAISTLTVNVQKSQAIAATDATKIGLSNFDSASFAVDANGFVTAAGTGILKTLTGNSGGAISPTTGNINTLGTGSITIAGAGSTLTTQLTGLTNHAILVGAGTATITNVGPTATTGQVLQSAGAAADPVFSTATYPSTTTISQILYSSSANVVAGLATANRAVLTTGATGIPVLTAIATDGQLIVGSTAGVPAAATITAGAGISIANGSNTITISTSGAGFTWTDVTGATQTIVAANGYLADRGGGVAFTLPASGTIGDVFRIVGIQGSWTLAQAAGQQVKFGSSATTVGVTGSLASTDAGDCIECVATNTSASTIWRIMSSVGNITVA